MNPVESVLEHVIRSSEASCGCFYFYDDDRQKISRDHLIHRGAPDLEENARENINAFEASLQDGPLSRSVLEGRPFFIDNVHVDETYVPLQAGTRSSLFYPVVLSENLLGFLLIESPETGVFGQASPLRSILEEQVERNLFEFARLWLAYVSENYLPHPFLSGDTDEWKRVKQELVVAAENDFRDIPVYLLGETGSGKEFAANFIHFTGRRGRNGAFVMVNCANINEEIAGSRLFGHKKGAFTGAIEHKEGEFRAADGGTLFLDEIGDLPMSSQRRLLRAIETGRIKPVGQEREEEVNTRLICASREPLERIVKRGEFRKDLYMRIRTLKIEMPPLRNWKHRIPDLVDIYRAHMSDRMTVPEFTEEATDVLKSYDYPGNCRELRNMVTELCLRSSEPEVHGEDVSAYLDAYHKHAFEEDGATRATDEQQTSGDPNIRELLGTNKLDEAKEELEKFFVEKTLERFDGDVSKTAEELGYSEPGVYYLCKKHDIQPKSFK